MFGVSLFVWTALISVTLLALAAGYALGGRLSDRCPSPTAPYLLLGFAGLTVLAVPWLQLPVLTWASGLGVRTGAFVGASLLFGPAFVCLGAVSPYFVRLLTREWSRLGRTVGMLSALSTAGSFAGALGTGYWAVASIGVSTSLRVVGVLLLTVACIGAAGVRSRRALLMFLPALALAGFEPVRPAQAALPDGTQAAAIFAQDSFYGAVRVIDYRFGERGTREMVIDGLVQGGVDLRDGRSVYEYGYLLQHLPRVIHPRGSRCLVVGLGAGIVPGWYAKQGVETVAVDIDPVVAAAARAFFALDPRVQVVIDDARRYIAAGREHFDYVILDVFNGDTTPGYLLSAESFAAMHSRLAPGGVLAMNFAGSLDGSGGAGALVRTMRTVFQHVAVYPVFDTATSRQGNMVILAADRALDLPAGLALDEVHPLAAAGVAKALRGAYSLRPAGALVLSDDFNPIDVADVAMKEGVRRGILETTPPLLLLGTPVSG
jgi:spermidine synthase